ncbi:hypothetical protein MMC34_000399 [Xylographa carneopallida]|nr:hypothetical protein [Xylographa carneopallida]
MQSSLLLLLFLPLFSFAQTTIVATVVVTAPSSSATSSSQYTSDDDFQSSIVNSTNVFRDEYNATALSWNDSLATYAADYAADCHWQHSGGPNGENLAQGYANVTDAVDAWGDERNEYDFNDPGFSEATGHFTQLVWKATTTVGCGRTLCNEMNDVAGWYVVCEYYPPGNVIGEFAIEVQGEVEGAEQCQQGTVCSGEKRSLRGVETWMWVLVILLVLVLS